MPPLCSFLLYRETAGNASGTLEMKNRQILKTENLPQKRQAYFNSVFRTWITSRRGVRTSDASKATLSLSLPPLPPSSIRLIPPYHASSCGRRILPGRCGRAVSRVKPPADIFVKTPFVAETSIWIYLEGGNGIFAIVFTFDLGIFQDYRLSVHTGFCVIHETEHLGRSADRPVACKESVPQSGNFLLRDR